MRCVVMGYSGSGKSTVSKLLAEKWQSDLLHLDCVMFESGWKACQPQQAEPFVDQFLQRQTSWVIDGNYQHICYEKRLDQADMIVLLLFNRFNCLRRALSRYKTYKGTVRDSMAEGCIEKMDGEFIWWILYQGRTHAQRVRYQRIIRTYKEKIIVIKNQRQLDSFIHHYVECTPC